MAVLRPEPQGIRSRPRQAHRERLGHAERLRLVLEILAAYARAHRALRRAPIATVVASLRQQSYQAAQPSTDRLDEARRLGRAVTRVLALVPGDTRCLVRSLVLTRVLARRGIQAKLVIGARAAPDFLAHAWVECSGDPVLAPGDGTFSRLVEL